VEAYVSGEDFSFIKFIGMNGDGMALTIELDNENTEFKTPMYFIQGEEDLLTLPELTKAYFNKIKAPLKEYITVQKNWSRSKLPNARSTIEDIKTRH
jgi:hypothetical protein